MCDWSSFTLRVWKVCKRDRFETNIATVQQDRRCSVTAGSIWMDSQALVLHWTTESSILGGDPPTALVAVREKNPLKSYGAVSRKLCHVVHWRGDSYWTTESQVTPIFWRIPSLIGSISHPRFVVCAFTVLPFSVSVYVHSAGLLLRGGM